MKVFDNNGATFDRFTVVTNEGEVYTMSDNALSPSGFNQYAGSASELTLVSSEQEIELVNLPVDVLVAIIKRLDVE